VLANLVVTATDLTVFSTTDQITFANLAVFASTIPVIFTIVIQNLFTTSLMLSTVSLRSLRFSLTFSFS
jgi:hypothetical protein